MAADLVPIRLSLSAGDRYTVWAPRWRDAGDEWEAFLGKDDDLYVFETVADLVAFVRTDSDNDLVDHPAWKDLTSADARKFDPAEDKQFDLVVVEELVAEKPTEESVTALAGALAIVSSIGSVCELAAVSKFFNGNPDLGTVSGGIDHFTGKAGHKRWNSIAEVIGRSWDDVLSAIDEDHQHPRGRRGRVGQGCRRTGRGARRAQEEADEPKEDPTARTTKLPTSPRMRRAEDVRRRRGRRRERLRRRRRPKKTRPKKTRRGEDDEGEARADGDTVVLGGDEDFWLQVGIDPIRIMTSSGTFYTLRCYLDDRPIFLGRNGRISVFSSERALARYLADEHDHDLADLSTYDDIRTAATDGSLAVDITDDNIYVLSGLADDFADGPDAVDRDQLDLAVELLRDIGDYSEESTVDKALETGRPLGKLVAYVLEPDSVGKPAAPYSAAVREWEKLEQFVDVAADGANSAAFDGSPRLLFTGGNIRRPSKGRPDGKVSRVSLPGIGPLPLYGFQRPGMLLFVWSRWPCLPSTSSSRLVADNGCAGSPRRRCRSRCGGTFRSWYRCSAWPC